MYIINKLQIFSHSLGTYDITEATLYNDLSNIGRICYSCHCISTTNWLARLGSFTAGDLNILTMC